MATLINLKKVQHGTLTWHNRKGSVRTVEPTSVTLFGHVIDDAAVLARAKERRMLDIWTPHATFEFASNHRKTFTGPEALRLWEAWKGVVYGQ